jgi:glyoxylase-like metal-dependent hydrolase (beta-lactamase superfamily II)
MTAGRPPLSYDVFTAPQAPFSAPPPRVGDPPAWDPKTSTLIFGARDAVLVDALMTVAEATALADWIALHQRQLTTIYITHGHADHFLGLPVLLNRFPGARAVASPGTVQQMREQSTPQVLDNRIRARFPGQIADTVTLAEPLDTGHFELEGLPLEVIETGHTDTVDSTSLHVPDLGLIVSGDVAYNHCHMFVAGTTPASRPNGPPPSTSWPRSTRPPSSPATRTRPRAIRPQSWPSPAATSNTTGNSARQACPTRTCSTPW